MPDRIRQVQLLIGSRFDGLYLPAGSLTTPSGLVPAQREPCTSCGGSLLVDDFGKELRRRKGRGWITDQFRRRQPCTNCGGSWNGDMLIPGAGWIARDPMDSHGARIGSTATTATARPRKTVICDACNGEGVRAGQRCIRCDGAGRRDLHVFELDITDPGDRSGDPLTDAVERRNAAGSYHELDQALAGIVHHVNKPPRYQWLTDNATAALRLLDDLYLPPPSRQEHDLEPAERALVDLALAYIADRMPSRIRVPGQVIANARELDEHRKRARGRGTDQRALEQRNRQIRDYIRRHVPTQWIAAEFGLSVSQVNRIANGLSEHDAA